MHFSPYDKATAPNIVVDGSRNANTLLTLSHWPRSGTPHELKADTSAEIAFKYLDSPRFHVQCNVVTNNHFDQDGLVAVFVLIDPETATRYRDLLIDVATAGDFGVFRSRDAARINFAVSALADPQTSPFPKDIFEMAYPPMAAELYSRMLELFPQLVAEPHNFKSLWESEDAKLSESEALLREGVITIQENRDLDFAVVQIPERLPTSRIHRFTSAEATPCHPMAIYNATLCTRILLIQGRHVEFQYRYESWVQLISRKPPARIDLSTVADQLNAQESSGGKWEFDGVDEITPRLHLKGFRETSISAEAVRNRIEEQLKTAPPAWDPYD
jgi:Family of unknown function (DUF6687)